MPNKKVKAKKVPSNKEPAKPNKQAVESKHAFFLSRLEGLRQRIKDLLLRRPHRSFRRTYRRDYVRSLTLPGYWAFTNSVRKVLFNHKKLFFGLTILYSALTILLIGWTSQDTYLEFSRALGDPEVTGGNWGELGKTSLMLTTILSGSLNAAPTELQRVYGILLALLVWLTTVWLLRALLADQKPKLRDGLYNAGAPFLSTFLVALVFMVQLLPIAFAALGYGAAVESGLLTGGVAAMIFWVIAGLLTLLSLYWVTSTFMALVVVALPGMYPLRAIRTAGDLVVGRRVRILLRMLWAGFVIVLTWILVMAPLVQFDAWLKGQLPNLEWLPFIPVVLVLMSSITVVWLASYTYLLYRKVVDDDAAPA